MKTAPRRTDGRPATSRAGAGDARPRAPRAGVAIPSFALYGESPAAPQEMLHIEEVQTRSRRYRWEIESHQHRGLYQVIWVESGAVAVTLDERREAVEGPAAIVVPPGVVHGFRFAPETDGLVLTLSARFLVEGDFLWVGAAFRDLFTAADVLRFAPDDASAVRLHAVFRELNAEFALPGAAEAPVAGWLARAVIWRLAREQAKGRQATDARAHRHQALFTRFLLLIEERFLEHWSIERYASRLGLSTTRLNRLARAERGCSALELVHERLTREACRRLVYFSAPASSIGAELGFEDPAYFSRFFKRRTGLSPHRYRQDHRAQR